MTADICVRARQWKFKRYAKAVAVVFSGKALTVKEGMQSIPALEKMVLWVESVREQQLI